MLRGGEDPSGSTPRVWSGWPALTPRVGSLPLTAKILPIPRLRGNLEGKVLVMTRLPAWLVLGSLLLFGSLHAHSEPPPVVAQVTRVEGAVALKTAQGNRSPLSILMELADGDLFWVPAGSRAELTLYENDQRVEVRGPVVARVDKHGVQVPENKKLLLNVTPPPVALQVRGGSMRDLSSDQPGGGRKRADKNVPVPEELRPFPAISLEPRPTLSWSAPQGATLFQVEIGRCGEALIEKSTTSGSTLTLSRDLQRDETYTYTVTAYAQDGKELGKESSWARVLPDSKVGELSEARRQFEVLRRQDPGDASSYLRMAALYNQEGLLLEAVEILQMLAQAVPEAPYPHARMQALYAALGMEAERQEAARQEAARSAR